VAGWLGGGAVATLLQGKNRVRRKEQEETSHSCLRSRRFLACLHNFPKRSNNWGWQGVKPGQGWVKHSEEI